MISPNWVSWWLLGNMKHDTSSIIRNACLAIISPLHMALVVSRHPNPFPEARGCFFLAGAITLLVFLGGIRWQWWALAANAIFLPQNVTADTDDPTVACSAGPIANSCKFTIWRQPISTYTENNAKHLASLKCKVAKNSGLLINPDKLTWHEGLRGHLECLWPKQKKLDSYKQQSVKKRNKTQKHDILNKKGH